MTSAAMATAYFDKGNQCAAGCDWLGAIEAFDHCLSLNPRDWQALANRGNAKVQREDLSGALEDYLAAAALNPSSCNIKSNLAVLLKELGELDLAAALLEEVLAAEPAHVDAWSNLGIVRQHQRRYQDAIACQQNALAIAGPSVARYSNLGNAYSCALMLDAAIEVQRKGLELAPDDANLQFNQSITLLTAGRYAEAWPLYEARWRSVLRPRLTQKRWQGEALGERTLLLWSEQGLGDSLQMVRLLPCLRRAHPQARLLLACPVSFHRLFAQFVGVSLLPADALPEHDCQLPLMSLPWLLGITLDNLPTEPYLRVPGGMAPPLPAASRRRVGVVWESGLWGVGIADLGRQHKSIPAGLFAEICRVPGIEFIALQPGGVPAELSDWVRACPISDFADTAALAAQMDLVICVDTAILHLAGAMGRPVWALLRAESAPFFLADAETAPWYPSVKLWRQPAPGAWEPVLKQVAEALAGRQTF
ncbi:hypothetical protein VL04_07190 [Chromobacterium violaceum]|uniref:tetratricopeptide repeat-containing glycosyltransferase family protein n=1 Tax=Chromobacterium violaceum TaxID=536 RepID=UPI0006537D87|nr:tetratricopeptide repeat-containing glycosyltransferase family protein [Chromobacterium violaceum]KMN50362.1 hypothetical protein VK93_07555 [Chromobacterium violaceum]KMN87551.1 hypothetical protein VL02_02380 [Chromobacterium violaceum]KMN90638.1 hypothetical protein VL04_07190 [Chromobacterium violaceum]KMO03320.1 hypothetical protein VL16_15630 [Chromobacterium violaceum]